MRPVRQAPAILRTASYAAFPATAALVRRSPRAISFFRPAT